MPYELKFPAFNNAALELTGLTGTTATIEFQLRSPPNDSNVTSLFRYFAESGSSYLRLAANVDQYTLSNATLTVDGVSTPNATSIANLADIADSTFVISCSASGATAYIGNRATIDRLIGFGIVSLIVTDDAGVHTFDISQTNGTGGVNTVLNSDTGTRTATLVGTWPTDDSQWIEYVDPNAPALTVTQTALTPGGTISGTYSNYDTIPTTLTVSDGTNTITIASPTITDNGDGTGSFSGTMPALPTTGTANLVLFGDVTVELS